MKFVRAEKALEEIKHAANNDALHFITMLDEFDLDVPTKAKLMQLYLNGAQSRVEVSIATLLLAFMDMTPQECWSYAREEVRTGNLGRPAPSQE